MSLPRIIGITGYAQHGKDTIASVLSRELGYSRIALADKLKECVADLDPLIRITVLPLDTVEDDVMRLSEAIERYGVEAVKQEPEVRRLYQLMGTEVGRNLLGEDVWIGALAREKGVMGSTRKVVIPDVRFSNEAAWVRRMHGEVWLVQRPDFDSGVSREHPSERNIPSIVPDRVFINYGPKNVFQEQVYRELKNRMAVVNA